MVASFSLDFFFAVLLLSTAPGLIPTTPLSLLTDYSAPSSHEPTYPIPSPSTIFYRRVSALSPFLFADFNPSSSSFFHFSILVSSGIRSSSDHPLQAFFFLLLRTTNGPSDTNNAKNGLDTSGLRVHQPANGGYTTRADRSHLPFSSRLRNHTKPFTSSSGSGRLCLIRGLAQHAPAPPGRWQLKCRK